MGIGFWGIGFGRIKFGELGFEGIGFGGIGFGGWDLEDGIWEIRILGDKISIGFQ